ncbi:MAG: hypothetical protein ACI8PG_003811, partial [Planctomycetota bacterium]
TSIAAVGNAPLLKRNGDAIVGKSREHVLPEGRGVDDHR